MRKPFQMFLRYSSSLESSGTSRWASGSSGWPLWERTQGEAIQSDQSLWVQEEPATRGSACSFRILSRVKPGMGPENLQRRYSTQRNVEISSSVGSRVNHSIKYYFTKKQPNCPSKGNQLHTKSLSGGVNYAAVKTCHLGTSEMAQQVKAPGPNMAAGEY